MERAAWFIQAILAAAVLDAVLILAWRRTRKKSGLLSSSVSPISADPAPGKVKRSLGWTALPVAGLLFGGLLVVMAQAVAPRPPELPRWSMSVSRLLGLALFASAAALLSWRSNRGSSRVGAAAGDRRGPSSSDAQIRQPASWERLRERLGRHLTSRPSSRSAAHSFSVIRDEPAAILRASSGRGPRTNAAVALLSSALMLFLGQTIRHNLPTQQQPAAAATILGLLLFFLAVRAFSVGAFPSLIERPLRAVAGWLGVSPSQAILLGLAPLLSAGSWLAAGDFPQMYLPVLAVTLWVSSVALMLIGTWPPGALHVTRPWARGEALAVGGLFLAGLLARASITADIPWILTGDEASGGLSALEWIRGERDNPFGVGWFDFPSLYFFVQSLSIRLFGQTIQALRLTSALAGALTVVAAYWFLREAFGRWVALAGAAYLSAFHFHIHFSRLGLNNVWDGLFLTLGAAAFWRGWNRGGRLSFAIAGLAFGLAQYFYASSRIIFLLLPLWLAVAVLRDRETVRARLPGLAIGILGALVIVLPIAMFYLAHKAAFIAPYSRFSLLGPLLESQVETSGESVWHILKEQFKTSALAFTGTDLRGWYQPGQPMLLPIPATLFLMGACLILLNLTRLPEFWLALWVVGAIAVGALSESTPAAQRYVFVAPAVAGAIALALERSARWFVEAWPRARWVILASVSGVLLLASSGDLRFYFGDFSANKLFGDVNTEVATQVGLYLAEKEPGTEVYFFGGRMGYYTHSTIRYLAPQAIGTDLLETLTAPPDWVLPGPTIFIFLPERSEELDFVRESYPVGSLHWYPGKDGELFLAYEVPGE